MDRAMQMIAGASDYLWLNALIVVPVAVIAAGLSRSRWCRPATRHYLWLVVLSCFILPGAAFRFVPSMEPGFGAASRAVVDGVARAERVGREVLSTPRWPASRLAHPGAPASELGAEAIYKPAPPAASPPAHPAPVLRALAEVERLCEWPVAEIATLRTLLGGVRERLASAQSRSTTSAEALLASKASLPVTEACESEAAGGSPSAEHTYARTIPDAPAPRNIPRASVSAPLASAPDRAPSSPPHLLIPSSPRSSTPSPAPSPKPTRPPTPPSQLAAQVEDWIAHAGVLRRAVADLPPIPAPIWLGGLGAVLAWRLAQYLAARHVLRGAAPAPEAVMGLVAESAELVGLRRAPRVFMVERRLSPMVWCAGRTRLILPADLWRTLDGRSKRAVLVHELAHLKRRDHWVWRISLVIGAVYWWHPVAWWAARRVRDEADFSCDAWVTALLPTSRRAYAEALLAAQSFVLGPRLLPLPALCMASTRTRRLSRRLIMVMTDVKAPRSSLAGLLLAATIGAGAFLVSPSLACPPDEEKTKKDKTKLTSTTPKAAMSLVSPATPKPPKAPKAAEPPHDSVAARAAAEHAAHAAAHAAHARHAELAHAMAGQAAAQPGQPGSDDIRRLLERLERLEQRLDSLNERVGGAPSTPRAPGSAGLGGARGGVAVAPRIVEVQPAPSLNTRPRAMTAPRSVPAPTPMPDADGPTETRTYKLPEGKRQAMWDLMARQDVPIFVSEDGEGIAVQGTPAQHRIFRAFVDMIHPDGAPHSDAGQDGAMREMLRLEELGGANRALAEVRAAQAGQQRQHIEHLRQMERAVKQQAQAVRRQAHEVEKQADRLREQADKVREKADQLREKAEEEQNEAKRDNLNATADTLEAEADAIESQADAVENDAEALEEQADAMEEQAEAAAEEIEEIQEAAAEEAAEEAEEAAADEARTAALAPAAPSAPAGVFAPSAPVAPARP